MLCLIGLYLYNAIECGEGRVYRIVHYAQKGGAIYGIFCAYCTKTTGAWKIRLTKLKNQFQLKILSTKPKNQFLLLLGNFTPRNLTFPTPYGIIVNVRGPYRPALDSYL